MIVSVKHTRAPISPLRGARIIVMGSGPKLQLGLKGSTGLLIAVAVVVFLLIAFPAYRLFFLVSVLIGLVIAAGLALWHKRHPIREEDVENKRPLGL